MNAALAESQKNIAEQSDLNNDSFLLLNGFWLLPLQGRDEGGRVRQSAILGIIGVEAPSRKALLGPRELESVGQLLGRAGLALEDKRLQQEIFGTLQRLAPEIEELQRFRSTPYYALSQLPEESKTVELDRISALGQRGADRLLGRTATEREPAAAPGDCGAGAARK